MNILSLFDGISCGQLALRNAGVQVDAYFSSEINDAAMKITDKHFPDTVFVGDVCNVSYKNGKLLTNTNVYDVEIDMLIGGSPCTDFSSIGYANGMRSGEIKITTLDTYLKLKSEKSIFEGESYLFWEYVRLLKEIKPKYFLLENVVMKAEWENVITAALGVKPIKINSSLLSAQNRPRLYWTNIDFDIPSAKNINLESVLDKTAPVNDVTSSKTVIKNIPRLIEKYGYIPEKFNAYNASKIKDKACALSRGSMVTSSCATLIFTEVEDGLHEVKDGKININNLLHETIYTYPTKLKDGRYNLRKLSVKEMERLQTLPDNYTYVEGVAAYKRSMAIGNCWTVDIITEIFKGVNK